MDPAYAPRPFRDDDWETFYDVRRRSGIDRAETPGSMRESAEQLRATGLLSRMMVVEERSSGTAVGFATVYREPIDDDITAGWVGGVVDPSHRRRGIGSALYAIAVREAEELGLRRLWARVAYHLASGVGFLTRRGFRERERSWESRLDPRTVDLSDLPRRAATLARSGVEVTTWSAVRAVAPAAGAEIFELTQRAASEMFRAWGATGFTWPRFRAWVLENAAVPADSIFLARRRGRFVGLTYAQTVADRPDQLTQQFTGITSEFRGQGIGTLLKMRLIEFAREHGVTEIRTVNEGRNHPILRVNRRLGFRRVATWLVLERTTPDRS